MILYFEKHISEGEKIGFFSQIKKVSYIVLTSVFIAVQLTLSNATNDAQRLKDKQHTLSYWNKTKNIYTINFQGYDSSVVEDSLEARNINDELEKFYQKSKDKLKIFIINSDNYEKESDGRGNQRYEFEYAGDKEEQIYSPAGRSIQIDENYLKRNPIQTCNGKAISKLIDYNQNTLNILVPEQYKKYEKKIIKNYKENFYFQKVTIDNYFRKNMNKPKNMLKKDKLSINIIYVKSNQSYFTYDSDTGNDKNQIIDPIAVIYTGGVDSSCIASMYAGDTVSGSIYFEDNSKKQGRAYRKVEALLIPGMEKADDYLLQAIVETVVLVIFLGITYIFGLWDIFKENAAGWTRSLYTGGFFIVYCLYAVVSGIYLCFLSEHGDVKAFYNIIFFFIAVCLVGLVEELVFRGVVFNLLLRAFPKTKGGITGAVVLGGVLFGLMHFSNMGAGVKFSSCLIQVISAGLMGVLFCMIYASTRNFWMLAIFHTVVDMGGLLSSGIFEGGGVADRINEFSAMNCIAFVVLGIPMLVMLRKSRRIRLEMLYNNVTIIDDEREGAKLAVVSLVLGICSIIFSFFGYLMGLGIVGMLASKMSKRAKQYNNAIATAGMITSIIGFVLSVICTIGMMVLFASGIYDRLVNMTM